MATVEPPRRGAVPEVDRTVMSAAAAGDREPRDERNEASPVVRPQERHEMIAMAAYYYAEARGFAAGLELEDWLRAEADIDALARPRGVDLGCAKQTE